MLHALRFPPWLPFEASCRGTGSSPNRCDALGDHLSVDVAVGEAAARSNAPDLLNRNNRERPPISHEAG